MAKKRLKDSGPGKAKAATGVRVFKDGVLLVTALVKLAQIISEWSS